MKKTIAAATLLALASAAPAFARTHSHAAAAGAYARVAPAAAAAQVPNAVYENGRYIGTDPDPNVRLQLRKDANGIQGF